MIPGRATIEGTRRFADRSKAAAGHFRQTSSLSLSSIGVGTYLGKEDKQTDAGYEACVELALSSGVNVFDSAINYRGQKSERAIGRALGRAIQEGRATREEVTACRPGTSPTRSRGAGRTSAFRRSISTTFTTSRLRRPPSTARRFRGG